MSKFSLSIIGAGRVGSSLALALAQAGYLIDCIVDSDKSRAVETKKRCKSKNASIRIGPEIKNSKLVIISIPDMMIGAVAQDLAASHPSPGILVCHTSGFYPAKVLSPVKECGCFIASLHPMASIPERFYNLSKLNSVCFGIEGDGLATNVLRKMVRDIQCVSISIPSDGKALYHAGCVLSTSMVLTLLSISEDIFRDLGVAEAESRCMVRSLVGSVMSNLRSGEISKIMTGPVARGEAEVVRRHLVALAKNDPEKERIYRLLSRRLISYLERNVTDPSRWRRVKRIL